MKSIAKLSDEECERLMQWCKNQTLEHEIFTGQLTCRMQKWWGYQAEYYFNRSHVFEREPIESDSYLAMLRNQFKPDADSILLYRYEVGGTIGEHLDKQCFEPSVTLINLVDDEANLFGDRPTTRFRWNRQNYELQHGEVVKFNSRVLHSVPKLKSARYSLQFRRITHEI
jgi:alkylated DNA repair dioxygenase AlkB